MSDVSQDGASAADTQYAQFTHIHLKQAFQVFPNSSNIVKRLREYLANLSTASHTREQLSSVEENVIEQRRLFMKEYECSTSPLGAKVEMRRYVLIADVRGERVLCTSDNKLLIILFAQSVETQSKQCVARNVLQMLENDKFNFLLSYNVPFHEGITSASWELRSFSRYKSEDGSWVVSDGDLAYTLHDPFVSENLSASRGWETNTSRAALGRIACIWKQMCVVVDLDHGSTHSGEKGKCEMCSVLTTARKKLQDDHKLEIATLHKEMQSHKKAAIICLEEQENMQKDFEAKHSSAQEEVLALKKSMAERLANCTSKTLEMEEQLSSIKAGERKLEMEKEALKRELSQSKSKHSKLTLDYEQLLLQNKEQNDTIQTLSVKIKRMEAVHSRTCEDMERRYHNDVTAEKVGRSQRDADCEEFLRRIRVMKCLLMLGGTRYKRCCVEFKQSTERWQRCEEERAELEAQSKRPEERFEKPLTKNACISTDNNEQPLARSATACVSVAVQTCGMTKEAFELDALSLEFARQKQELDDLKHATTHSIQNGKDKDGRNLQNINEGEVKSLLRHLSADLHRLTDLFHSADRTRTKYDLQTAAHESDSHVAYHNQSHLMHPVHQMHSVSHAHHARHVQHMQYMQHVGPMPPMPPMPPMSPNMPFNEGHFQNGQHQGGSHYY